MKRPTSSVTLSALQSLPASPLAAHTRTLGYVGRTPGTPVRDSDAWYTPERYVHSARHVMGTIDLDPFSSAEANAYLVAALGLKTLRYFSPTRSAFCSTWRDMKDTRRRRYTCNVWMNPPYSSGIIGPAVARFLEAFTGGEITQAVVLVNNASDTKWFHHLAHVSIGRCDTNHRIAFVTHDGKHQSGNTRGQTFFYFATPATNHSHQFYREFAHYGLLYGPPMMPSPLMHSGTGNRHEG